MHESPQAYFHLDQPSDGAVLPAGPVTLRGWAAGRHGRPLMDLRLRLAGGIQPTIFGHPRPDLAAFFGLRDPFVSGGFEATLTLPAGPQEIAFEAQTIDGHWHPVGTVRLTGDPGSVVVRPTAPPAIQPHEFARALLCTLRRARTLPLAQAARDIAEALPRPAVLCYPALPFHGHLHQPALLERVLFGRLRLEGWLFHESAVIRRVAATADLQAFQDLTQGPTPAYVPGLFPQFSAARTAGFSGLIDVPAQLGATPNVRLYAELADGSWHLCHVQRTQTWDQEQEKEPFLPFSLSVFVRAWFVLRNALLAAGFAVPSDRAFWAGVRGAYREFRASSGRPGKKLASPTPRRLAAPLASRRAALITHNLGHEGAPLFLLELARQLKEAGWHLKIISPVDGALAADYARLGVEVRIVEAPALRPGLTRRELARAIATLAPAAALHECDLVIANTLSAYWGVHLAHQADRPSLLYIHESTTPAAFYLGQQAPAVLPLIEETFGKATHVSFLTETTRVYYRPWLGPDNHSINPGWIDVPAIDRYLAAHPREELRRRLKLAADTRLVINVGSVCDRKGQHIFARGVDLLWRQQPALAAGSLFLMIGGRDTLFDHDLRRLLVALDRPNLRIIPATDTPLAYYGAADLFVCSSYEESFPRVVMEAMASRVPIISTGVHGVQDLLRPEKDGTLIPPGHSQAIADSLQLMLADPALAQQCATRARARVETEFTAAVLLPKHTALASRIATGQTPP